MSFVPRLSEKKRTMCTINMSFNLPNSAAIDVEALKQQMQAYFNLAISFPSILKKEPGTEEQITEQMLNRFSGAWHGDESAEEIIAAINEHKSIREPLSL